MGWSLNLDLLAVKSPGTQPPRLSRGLCAEAPSEAQAPPSCPALCLLLPARAWVPQGTGLPWGRTLPAWWALLGDRGLAVSCEHPLALFWMLLEHAESARVLGGSD